MAGLLGWTLRELEAAGRADVVISDMSPNITGHYSMDHARSVDLAEFALKIACSTLKKGGNFVVKVFQGDMFKRYFDGMKTKFRFVKGHSPAASRKSSSEIYVVAKGYRGP
jgi:23S rRNA (uridine2552-2'-O)-methyltransferase